MNKLISYLIMIVIMALVSAGFLFFMWTMTGCFGQTIANTPAYCLYLLR